MADQIKENKSEKNKDKIELAKKIAKRKKNITKRHTSNY